LVIAVPFIAARLHYCLSTHNHYLINIIVVFYLVVFSHQLLLSVDLLENQTTNSGYNQ